MPNPNNRADAILAKGGSRLAATVAFVFRGDSIPFVIICTAGLLGGALSESAYELAGSPLRPGGSIFSRIGLGMIAAGLGTLILANSDRRDSLRLFFFALLCGLCYPSVIGQAMSDVERRATEATQSRDLAVQKNVIENTPAAEIRPEVKQEIERQIVDTIEKAATSAAPNAETIKEISELGKVARENGYDSAAITAADALTRLNVDEKTVDAVILNTDKNSLNTDQKPVRSVGPVE
jgi:hypothetical protein